MSDYERFIKIIEEWQSFWMNQTQNSEADRANYFRRALGVDANMKHDLAQRLLELLERDALKAEVERLKNE